MSAKKNKIISSIFSNNIIPADERAEFENDRININYNRNKNLAILLFIVFSILLIIDYQNYSKGLWAVVPGYVLLFYTHLMMTSGMLLILLYSILCRLDSATAKMRQKKIFVLLATYVNVIGGALVSTADQYINGEITVFVLCAFTYAIVSYQRPVVNLGMYAVAYSIFLVGITYAQINPDILRGHYINGTILILLALFLSAILYFSKVKDFISSKTIESQKIKLEQANHKLSATNHELQESLEALDESQNMIFSLALTLESKDQNTHGHSERVVDYSSALADALALSDKDKVSLYRASVLHDIGKIGIPDAILNKPLALTEEEWEIMKTHPLRGEAICSKLKFAQEILPIIRYHHERFDGKGYPDGLCGEEIPLLARIVSIADTVDAITSPRSYRLARTMDFAIEELQRCSGTQFDPSLVKVFMSVYQKEQFNNR